MNALELNGLCKRWPGFSLEDVTLALPAGCILGLVGENGAGKTTTIKLILNMLRADGGSATVLGQDAAALDKNDVGVVLDEAGLPQGLNPGQIGRIMSGIFRNWDAACYARYLDRFELPHGKPYKAFSRGMKMKLAIAIALSHNARLLVLDEPTGGLDPVVRDEIVELFSEFTRDADRAVLISSHIVSDLEKICDYIAFLHKGRLVLCEEKDRLLEEYALIRLTEERLRELPEESIISCRASGYATEALVLRGGIPAAIPTEHTSLEDIILFMAKGDERK